MNTSEFKFYCSHCDQPLKCEPQFAGRQIECPACHVLIRIPNPPPLHLQVDWNVDQMLGYIRTWSAVRALEKAKGPQLTEKFSARLRDVWGAEVREVRWPLVLLAGRIQ